MPAAAAPQAPAEAGTSSADAGPVPMRDRLRALYDAARAAREAAMARDRWPDPPAGSRGARPGRPTRAFFVARMIAASRSRAARSTTPVGSSAS